MTGKQKRKATQGKEGFTLLEMLVAVSILSIVMIMLFGTFNSVMASRPYLASRAELNHTARFIIQRLTGDLSCASLLPNNPAGFFNGSGKGHDKRQADAIRFTGFGRRFVIPGAGSDQAVISWFVTKPPKADTYTLMRGESQDVIDADGKKADKQAMEVTNSLLSFNVTYLNGGKWEDEFDSAIKHRLPLAVKIEFELGDERGYSLTREALVYLGARS